MQDPDLKWVEDNIPAATASSDNTFPSYAMDSDEVGMCGMYSCMC